MTGHGFKSVSYTHLDVYKRQPLPDGKPDELGPPLSFDKGTAIKISYLHDHWDERDLSLIHILLLLHTLTILQLVKIAELGHLHDYAQALYLLLTRILAIL